MIFHCARPTRPSEAARCASTEDHQAPSSPLFREHRGPPSVTPLHYCHTDCSFQPSFSSFLNSWRGSGMGGSASTARIERAHSYRARSASKEAGWLTRLHRTAIFPILISFTFPGWQGGAALDCARRTRAFRGRAFREQGGRSSLPATHLIPLLTQTPRHRIGVSRVRIERPVGAAH